MGWDDDFKEEIERDRFYDERYQYSGEECPECGSCNVKVHTSLEDTDADGNRGRYVTFCLCRDCDGEWEI